jgi:hypothetical protein
MLNYVLGWWNYLMTVIPSQFHLLTIAVLVAFLFSRLGKFIKAIIVLAIVFFLLTYAMSSGILSVPSWWPTAIHLQ